MDILPDALKMSNQWIQYVPSVFLCWEGTHKELGPEVIKHFHAQLSWAGNIFSANNYENANFCWHFHIY